jgi:ribosomal protein L37E
MVNNLNVKNIITGWKNFISKSEVTEKLATKRAEVCAACPNAKQGKLLAFIKDSLKEIEGAYCNSCGCPLSAKIRSNDICPENKW